MTDTTHEAPERIWWNVAPLPHSYTSTVQFSGGTEYRRADLVQAAVAAALREAAKCMKQKAEIEAEYSPFNAACFDVAERKILTLITPDAGSALDRSLAAERERCAKIVEDQYMVDGIAEILAEDLAAAIRAQGET